MILRKDSETDFLVFWDGLKLIKVPVKNSVKYFAVRFFWFGGDED